MAKIPAEQAAQLRLAFDMHDVGVAMMQENLRRKFPQDSERQLMARLVAWLRTRPGAVNGDAIGTLRQATSQAE